MLVAARDAHGPGLWIVERGAAGLTHTELKGFDMTRRLSMATFAKTHGLPCILMGFGLHDDQLHAPNEKFSLTSFHGGTRSCAYLYEELGR